MYARDKSDCCWSLSAALVKGIKFRHKVGDQYNDPRNARAEVQLAKLADDAPTLSDSCWKRLQPHFETRPKQWREALSETVRMVGFKNMIEDFESFADALLDVLNEPVIA
jgi:hypothetical protein